MYRLGIADIGDSARNNLRPRKHEPGIGDIEQLDTARVAGHGAVGNYDRFVGSDKAHGYVAERRPGQAEAHRVRSIATDPESVGREIAIFDDSVATIPCAVEVKVATLVSGQQVVPRTAVQRIAAGGTGQHVIATEPHELAALRVRDEAIVSIAADKAEATQFRDVPNGAIGKFNRFDSRRHSRHDAVEHHAVAAIIKHQAQIAGAILAHCHLGGCDIGAENQTIHACCIGNCVEPVAQLEAEAVVASTAIQLIISATTDQRVATIAADKGVIALTAFDDIVSCTAIQRFRGGPADDAIRVGPVDQMRCRNRLERRQRDHIGMAEFGSVREDETFYHPRCTGYRAKNGDAVVYVGEGQD